MHTNANKCAGLVDHTYIHKRRRVDSRLDSHGSMQHGPDGLRTGCDRGQCSTYVPLHAIQVFIRLLSVPCLFDCVVARLNAGPSPQVARTMGSASDLGHLLNEILQVRLVKGRPAWHALSIRDEQSCDCYLVGAVARDLEALAGADELGRVELAGDE